MRKPKNCTQNNGDCNSCSLVSYGRDCQNNPVDPVKKYLSKIGRKGGEKSKRTLTRKQSLAMIKAREEGRARKEECPGTANNN